MATPIADEGLEQSLGISRIECEHGYDVCPICDEGTTPINSEGLTVDVLGLGQAVADSEGLDALLREIYGRAFDEGAESTIEQWGCSPDEPPVMPHKDCKNEGSYQFVEDVRPKFAALASSLPLRGL